MTQVFLADIVFVDARHRRGLSVGAEMMWAKFHAKPVIILAPEDTHYRKSNVEIWEPRSRNMFTPLSKTSATH